MKKCVISNLKSLACCVALAIAGQAYADVPSLTVSGNRILSGGEAKSFAGNSFFWSNTGWEQEKMYNAEVVKWLKDDWKSTIVRAALGADEEGSYLEDPQGNVARIETVVEAAIANDMYVIIDFHSHHAEDKKAAAIAFFEQMASKYGHHNNVIYEIYNEPLSISWSNVIKPYAEDVISAIRAIDPDNLIIVGTPTWSQDVDVASRDPIMGTNIAYTLHFYAGTHGQYLRDKAQTALNNGVALMVTEWGAVNADGDGAVAAENANAWLAFLKQNKISHLNWAVSDKEEGSSIIKNGVNPKGQWSASDLTASGQFVKNIISNWGTTIGDNGGDSGGDGNPDDGSVLCEHVVTSSWSGGFQGAIRITNNGTSTINGWHVNWSYTDGTQILTSWNANLSGSGNYSASNLSWNAVIAPSQSVEFGLIGQGGGNASAVTGDVCDQ